MFFSTNQIVKTILILTFFTTSSLALAKKTVVIGAIKDVQYPILVEDGSGLSKDLVKALNELKSDYTFKHRSVPAVRLKHLINNGLIDLAAFHNVDWGWNSNKVKKSKDVLASGERYITLKGKGKSQRYFNKMGKAKKVGVRGKKYRMVDFETDEKVLKQKHNFKMLPTEVEVVNAVFEERADVGVVSDAIIQYMKEKTPAYFKQLIVSKRYDSQYQQHYVVGEASDISVETFNELLAQLQKNGKLKKIYKKYGLKAPKI